MSEFIKTIKKKMIDAGIENFKELAKEIGMKYDTFLVRMKDPTSFRIYEAIALCKALGMSEDEMFQIVRELSN